MKIIPLNKYLYVKVSKESSIGGIVLADSAQSDDEVVEIVGVGGIPEDSAFKRGMRILCIPGSGIPTPKKDHVLVREQDVVAIVED